MLNSQGDILFATTIGFFAMVLTKKLQEPAHQPPARPPRSPSPSPPSSPLLSATGKHYNEETIVSLINEFYSLLVSLAYLRPSQIIYPPPGTGHNINEKLCNTLNIDVAVISLMKRVPYIDGPYEAVQRLEGFDEEASVYRCHLFPGSRGYSFLRGDDIVESRDPENDGVEGVRLNYMLSHDVALSHCLRDGMILVLDTKASMLPLKLLLRLWHKLMEIYRYGKCTGKQFWSGLRQP
jgi:hypothetical protein